MAEADRSSRWDSLMQDDEFMYVAPEKMTVACGKFFHDSFQSEMLSQIASYIFIHPGEFSKTIASFLRKWGTDHPMLQETFTDEVLERIRQGTPKSGIQRHLSLFLFELIHCRMVDSFNMYITDLTAEIFTARPESLRSSKKIALDEILQFPSIDDMIAFLAEQQVTELSHKGFDDLAIDFQRRFGLSIADDPDGQVAISRMVAVRNLIVHNHGIINDHFIRQAPSFFEGTDPRNSKGNHIELNPEVLFYGMHRLRRVVASLDDRTSSKFDLKKDTGREDMVTWGTILKDLLDLNDGPSEP